VRGYNPLDVHRYKEYLQHISVDEAPLRPFEHPLTFPIVGDVPIRHKSLLDLLGVRYLLQPTDSPLEQAGWRKVCEDSNPASYDVIADGRRAMSSYTLYENVEALPRAFVVPHAVPLTSASDLTRTDFRRQVLLENFTAEEKPGATEPGYWSASIREYQPNHISLDVTGTAPGWLVLTDVWYPGWECAVDGERVEVYRANTLFRAVRIEAGRHEVVFRFAPESYRWGRIVSLLTLTVGGFVAIVGFLRRLRWSKCQAASR
jgi:hypothetical protein